MRHGDLTFREARVGATVRCVIPPDMSLWEYHCPHQSFSVPSVGDRYVISASGCSYEGEKGVIWGILLREIRNPQVTIPLPGKNYTWSGEPFFLLATFVLVTR